MRKLIVSLAASAVITAGAVAGLQVSSRASTDGKPPGPGTRPGIRAVQAACSIRFACLTSLLA